MGYEVLTAGSGSINSEGNEVILKSTTGSTGSMYFVALTAAHDFSKFPTDSLQGWNLFRFFRNSGFFKALSTTCGI